MDLNVKLDPSLIGGFRLVVDDLLLDASVSSQLEKLRRQFIEKTSRIV
ncbi:MAG: F0F1 ATP synthase subunit delta [Bacteroidales bacterium]|nr:F0F1 ATP synthase subunit delta [Bacteroidales bacterium]